MPLPPCPFSTDCALARSVELAAALQVWESCYCRGSCDRCERYRLLRAGQAVPGRLLPNGRLQNGPHQATPRPRHLD
jgi:hypothetical protein